MYQETIRIPKERISVLIGTKGETKRKIQQKTNTRLQINDEGDVLITGEDNLNVFLTSNIIKAIARGFNPNIALLLVDESNTFELLDIVEYVGNSQKAIIRIRARIIGTRGKARRNIERMTNTHISVYGKTVCILGEINNVDLARRAIEKILNGSPHGKTYSYIERQKQENFKE